MNSNSEGKINKHPSLRNLLCFNWNFQVESAKNIGIFKGTPLREGEVSGSFRKAFLGKSIMRMQKPSM